MTFITPDTKVSVFMIVFDSPSLSSTITRPVELSAGAVTTILPPSVPSITTSASQSPLAIASTTLLSSAPVSTKGSSAVAPAIISSGSDSKAMPNSLYISSVSTVSPSASVR